MRKLVYGMDDLKDLFPVLDGRERDLIACVADSLVRRFQKALGSNPKVFGATEAESVGWGDREYRLIVDGRFVTAGIGGEVNVGGEFQSDFAGNDASHVVSVYTQVEISGETGRVKRVYSGLTDLARRQRVEELAREASQNYYLRRERPGLAESLLSLSKRRVVS